MGTSAVWAPRRLWVEDRAGHEGFAAFFAEAEPRLRRALVARLGPERGREATAEALAWAFEHWTEVAAMANGVGYLYRVGVSRTRSRKAVELERVAAAAPVRAGRGGDPELIGAADPTEVDPELWAAVLDLTDNQRVAVVLVHAFGWSMGDVADLLEVSVPTVGTHLRRGLANLRRRLGDAPGPAAEPPAPGAGPTIPETPAATDEREERTDG
jgi:RNA polymerase sigma-70 factor (ECF subfamily)